MNRLNSHFPRPLQLAPRVVSSDGQSALVDNLGVSPSRSRLLTGPHRLSSGDRPRATVLRRQSYPITTTNLQSTARSISQSRTNQHVKYTLYSLGQGWWISVACVPKVACKKIFLACNIHRCPNFSRPAVLHYESKSKAVPPCHGGSWWERKYSSYSFLTLALDGSEWSESCPSCTLPPMKGPGYPLDRRLSGPQSQSGQSG
jgi:hypothetical protein